MTTAGPFPEPPSTEPTPDASTGMTASDSHVPTPTCSPDSTSIMATGPFGIVRGVVLRDGGRDPRSGAGSTPPVPIGADPVTARASTGEPAVHTVTANDGSFEFHLPPGTYLINEHITGASAQVNVTAHLTSTVTLTVPGA